MEAMRLHSRISKDADKVPFVASTEAPLVKEAE
jgi:hypothetical protein